MRIVIAGSREFDDYNRLYSELAEFISKHPSEVVEIVSGGARGADRLGEQYARNCGYKLHRFPAQWDLYGKSAGYIRNAEMLKYAEEDKGALVAFWDGKSKGTKHMIDIATKAKLKVVVVRIG